MTTDTQQRG